MYFIFIVWYVIMLSLYWYVYVFFFFFKQKTAYEMRISDWSSDVCSSDLVEHGRLGGTRMGSDAKTSVLNGYCQAHDVKNLFVADGEIGRASCRERVCQYV